MIKPLGDRVVVKVEKVEEATASGFVLASNTREATKVATVVAVGQGIRTLNGDLVASSVAVGDKVLIENGSGLEVKVQDETVTIVRESDVLAVLA